jgi:hypothetical protein
LVPSLFVDRINEDIWGGHVARIGRVRNRYKIIVTPEGIRSLRKYRRRLEDNTEVDLKEIGYEGVDWINVARVGYSDMAQNGILLAKFDMSQNDILLAEFILGNDTSLFVLLLSLSSLKANSIRQERIYVV